MLIIDNQKSSVVPNNCENTKRSKNIVFFLKLNT